jgi:hypothetical protein
MGKPDIYGVTDLRERSTSLQKEFHLRADALDADVAELAALLPTRRFKMRVLTTDRARWSPFLGAFVIMVAYVALATLLQLSLDVEPLVVVGVILFFMLAFSSCLHSIGGGTVPGLGRKRIVVYVRNGHLSTVKPGYEDLDGSWEQKSCTRLVDEEHIVVASLFAELARGIDTYSERIEVLDAAIADVRPLKEKARILAEVQSTSRQA